MELLKGDYKSGFEHYEYRFKREKPLSVNGNPTIKTSDSIDLSTGDVDWGQVDTYLDACGWCCSCDPNNEDGEECIPPYTVVLLFTSLRCL